MALVYPLKNVDPYEYEGPIDHTVDQLVALGFCVQKSTTPLGSPTSTTGIAYDAGNVYLVIKTEGTKISLQIAGNEYAWLDNTGILSASKLKAVSNLYSPNLDPATAVALAIGGTNASSITIGKSGLPVLHPGGAQAGSLHLNAAVPAVPANGDIWPDGADVIVRSGGVSQNLSTLAGYRQVVDCGIGVGDGTKTAFQLQWSPGCSSDAMGTWQNGTKPRTNYALQSEGAWNSYYATVVGSVTHTQVSDTPPIGVTSVAEWSYTGGGAFSDEITRAVVPARTVGTIVSVSAWVKWISGATSLYVDWGDPAAGGSTPNGIYGEPRTMTGTWQRLKWEGLQTGSAAWLDFSLRPTGASGKPAGVFRICGIQAELGPIATEYIPTTSAAVTVTPAYWPAMGGGFEPVYEPNGPVSIFFDGGLPRTNYAPHSQDAWHAGYATIAGAVTHIQVSDSPPIDGVSSVAEWSYAGGGAISDEITRVTVPAQTTGTVISVSAWVKWISGATSLYMDWGDPAVGGSTPGGPYGEPRTITGTWQRIKWEGLKTGTGGFLDFQFRANGSVGKPASVFRISGIQAELGPRVTEYIPTTTAPVTAPARYTLAPADYTLDPHGLVTLATAPATGAVLSWSGAYYSTDEHAYFDAAGRLSLPATDSSGTPGSVTINSPTGQFAVAAGASSATVTNSSVSATSVVLCVIQSADATLVGIASVVPGAGSFVFTGNAAATAATKVGFVVVN